MAGPDRPLAGGARPSLEPAVEAVLRRLCRWTALAGGLVLVALMVMTVASITGRALVSVGLGPVPGDFELLEAGTAFATFCFLPWCQFHGGHVTVDLIAPLLGPRRDARLSAVFNTVMTLAAVVIGWRLWLGMLDKLKYGETSFILQFPSWWGYAVCIPPLLLYIAVSAFTAWRALGEGRRARAGGFPGADA